MYKEILCNFENIRKAYRLAHRGKTNAPEVIEFDKNKLYNLHKLQKKLINKEWDNIFEYYNFKIRVPKERNVDALTFEGRIVQHVLVDEILRPWFEKRLIKENSACRIGKGTHYALRLLKQAMLKQNTYALKIDVKKYFPNIDREILKELLKGFPDNEIIKLLEFIIDEAPDNNGIPIGNQTSQWFALYYLDAIDRIIKNTCKGYVRYMDDLIVLGAKDILKSLLERLKSFAWNKRKLIFNSKTQICPIRKGITFLGWRFIKRNKIIMKIPNEKRKLRISKIKETYAKYFRGKTTFEQFCDSIRSIKENLRYGNTYYFRMKYGGDIICLNKLIR